MRDVGSPPLAHKKEFKVFYWMCECLHRQPVESAGGQKTSTHYYLLFLLLPQLHRAWLSVDFNASAPNRVLTNLRFWRRGTKGWFMYTVFLNALIWQPNWKIMYLLRSAPSAGCFSGMNSWMSVLTEWWWSNMILCSGSKAVLFWFFQVGLWTVLQ